MHMHIYGLICRERLVESCHYPPLLSYLEVLPSSYYIDNEDITKHFCEDGSLFQSPSATAFAFMVTGNKQCLSYLESLVQRCPNGGNNNNNNFDYNLEKIDFHLG